MFLERPDHPVTARFTDRSVLERELESLASGVLAGEFPVAEIPGVYVCNGCPGEGGLCSWSLEMTRRDPEAPAPAPEPELQCRLF